MQKGVLTLGEALVDFVPIDTSNTTYQKCPGGAPANVAVGLARLGAKAAFVGKVGEDPLGMYLKKTLEDYGVCTDYMSLTQKARTGTVFVTLAKKGERSFDFLINPSSDCFLNDRDVETIAFSNYNILHIGTISLIREPSRTATLKAVEQAKNRGLKLSFDPNLRRSLWDSEARAKETVQHLLEQADIVKISEEELAFLSCRDTVEAAKQLRAKYNIPVLFVTLGAKGSWAITQEGHVQLPALQVNVVDTTGAGDAYVSGLLYHFNKEMEQFDELSLKDFKHFAHFASVSGGLTVSAKGAMTALPTLDKVSAELSVVRLDQNAQRSE